MYDNTLATAPGLPNTEDFWEDLLAFIEDRRVIPIVGAELLTLPKNGTAVPLYRAVAERLLAKYGLASKVASGAAVLREHFELNDAVSALAASGRRVKDLYRPVHEILSSLLHEHPEPPAPLRELASVNHFDLFVTTTPDDLLVRALDAVRFDGRSETAEIEYAPKLPTPRRRDIPALRAEGYTGVFYLFGKSAVDPFYAIHDEDALEFPYTLQENRVPERILSELRSRNLLLIGCTFADWLSRFFLRLSNCERLFSDQRTKREFLIGEETGGDRDLTVFLERFSQDTRCYRMPASNFVSELYRRWKERNPAATQTVEFAATRPAGHAIFLSYGREDIEAARKLHAKLEEMGGDVWFDQDKIKGGDDWPQQTRAAIQRCSLFMPLISVNTENRGEGEFIGEWRDALERSRKIQGRNFIIPVVLDTDYRDDARAYSRAHAIFGDRHFEFAPDGAMSEALRAEVQKQLRALRRAQE